MVVPLVVCYSGSHYEGLVPATVEDVVKCMELVEQYKAGTYNFTDQDVPVIRNQFPVSEEVTIDTEYEDIRKLKPKQRTEEQRKRLRTIQDARSKRKRSNEKVINDKEMAKKRREERSMEKVVDDRKKAKTGMKTTREKRSTKKVQDDRVKNKAQKRTARTTKSSFEGRCAASLQDVATIHELKDTKDSIGDMKHRYIFSYFVSVLTCIEGANSVVP